LLIEPEMRPAKAAGAPADAPMKDRPQSGRPSLPSGLDLHRISNPSSPDLPLGLVG
jgi:hypothetical protein